MARWTAVERASLALVAALLAMPVRADDAALEFRRHGQHVAKRTLAELKRIAPAQTVRVVEPYEQNEVAFSALALDRVLDAVYGAGWRREEELLFTCRDGYQPTVSVPRVVAHTAWIAFAREAAPFSIRKFESGRVQEVSLAPFYLIWENVHDARMRSEGDYGWPYQLAGIELIRSRDRFPKMAPPAEAPEEIHKGFAAFRIHCSRCHPVNGEGGQIGPELNRAASPAGRRETRWLHDWIDDPNRISPGTRMERLNPSLPDRDAVIASIIAYLRAIADHPLPASADGG